MSKIQQYVDESDDPDAMGECPTESEDEGEAAI
jgi:hypothetical protein